MPDTFDIIDLQNDLIINYKMMHKTIIIRNYGQSDNNKEVNNKMFSTNC